MKTGTAIRIVAGGLTGAAVLLLCSMLSNLPMGHNWPLAAVLFGGTTGLVVAYLLVKAKETKSDLERKVDALRADLSKSTHDRHILTDEHEQDKKAFIQTQSLYEQVFNTTSTPLLVVGKNGAPLLVNGPARSLLRLDDNFTEESLKSVLTPFDVWKEGTISRDPSAARINFPDGTSRLFGFSTSPLTDDSLVVVFQDITVAVENQARKQRSEELALVGEMVSRLSHEIKNPLASILVGVKTLQRDTPQSSQQGYVLQLISEEVNSLMKIISELLESARPRTYLPRPVNIQPLLEKCIDTHGLQAEKRGVRLELVRFRVSTVVLVDEHSMLRALSSLIQNALDACSRGDVISIGWRELDHAEKDELLPGFSGNVVSLFVEDNGPGVPQELSASESTIFKAFVSTKAAGTGLGLTVAQDIVEEHGGIIVVSDLSNRGTRVELILPIPEGIHCWDWNSSRSVECTSCDVRSAGMGYFCWKQKQGAHQADTGQWPVSCLKCGYFRASSLTPFFKSRLIVPKVE